jgi:hypothetical protein
MTFFKFLQERWLSIYTSSVLFAFALGYILKDQSQPHGAAFYAAGWLTLPWSMFPAQMMPRSVSAFLSAFYGLPLILAAMTLNIAFIGLVEWVCSRLATD